MANVLDDLTTRFKSFSDTLEQGLSSISDLPSMLSSRPKGSILSGRQLHGGSGPNAPPPTKSRREREARAELILEQLPQAYFDQGFDPLEHELRQMTDETKQEDVDSIVERLSAAVEVVGVRLAKQVQKQQDKLIAGINNVTHVEDDLKVAHVICSGTRSQLRMAAEDVQRQIKIITTTRKKQAYMKVLEVANKMKKVQDLQQTLRKVHEEGDFGEAILLCMDCFQDVDTLSGFKVEPELRLTVQQQYYDTQQRLSSALLNECSNFTPQSYSKLLEAYLLQGLPGPALAAKVLACFRDSISDAAMRLVRSMVLAKAAFSSPHGSSAGGADSSINGSPSARSSCSGLGDCATEELCKLLSGEMVQPCLTKLLEVVFELLCSYRRMAQWHTAGIEQQQAAAAAAAAALRSHCEATRSSSSSGGGSGDSAGDLGGPGGAVPAAPSQADLDQVQAATSSMLEAVAGGLASSRMEIIEVAGARVCELLAVAKKCKGEDFIKVLEGCLHFVSIAEAFTGCSLPLRATVLSSLAACVDSYQKANMEALRMSLALDDWQPLAAAGNAGANSKPNSSSSIDIGSLKQQLSSSPYVLPAHGQPGCVADFDAWVQAGNPFSLRAHSRAVGGQSVVLAASGQPVQPPEQQASGTPLAAAGRVATKSSLLVLRRMNSLAAMMPVVPASQPALWAAVAELFDNFLLACFILFSDVSLEALVWQDDLLPHRLRSALLRITTSPGCKYKAQVEELQRTKPATRQAATSSSILDCGFITSSNNSNSHPNSTSSSPASKFDAFTRKFKDTMVDLINTDLSQPLPNSSTHSPSSHYTMQQQHQSILSPSQQQQLSPALKQGQAQLQQQQEKQQQQNPSLQRHSLQAGSTPAGVGSAEQHAASPAGGSMSAVQASGLSMTHKGMTYQVQGSATRVFGLKERVLAIESLTAIADTLKAAKTTLLAQLAPAGMSKEVEGYFSRTVDAALDLRDAIYRGGARQLLAAVVDPDRGTAAHIASCNYNVKEPATRYQPWAEVLVKQYRSFSDFLAGSGLPQDVQQKMWEAAVRLGCDAILDGLGRVSRCSLEGRAGMSLDLSAVEKGLRPMAPATAVSALRLADNYIKAFYIPWEELGRWTQVHLAEYGKQRVLVLVEAMAEAYGIKRQQKTALIDKLNAELAEFG